MNRHHIAYGDRIFVRVIQNRKTVVEVTFTNVADLTSLAGEIRHAGRGLEGLTTVYIRNHTQGWSMERPFRFYVGIPSPRTQAIRAASASYSRRSLSDGTYIHPANTKYGQKSTHTTYPWETH